MKMFFEYKSLPPYLADENVRMCVDDIFSLPTGSHIGWYYDTQFTAQTKPNLS